MNLKDSMNKYSELYLIKKNRTIREIVYNAMAIIGFIGVFLWTIGFIGVFVAPSDFVGKDDKVVVVVGLLFCGLAFYEFFYGFSKLHRLENKIKKSKTYSGQLSDIFDMECYYTKHVLSSYLNIFEKHVEENKGIKGEFIFELLDKISSLKKMALEKDNFRLYQDLYDLSKSYSKKTEKIDNILEEVKVLGHMEFLNQKNAGKNFQKISSFFYAVISALTGLVFTIYFAAYYYSEVDNKEILLSILYFPMAFLGALFLIIFIMRNLPLFKAKKESLYDLFDMSNPEVLNFFQNNINLLHSNIRTHNGYSNFLIYTFRSDIKARKRSAKLTSEEKDVLIDKNTNLGKLLNDINVLKKENNSVNNY